MRINMKKVVLSRKAGWIILTILVFVDGFLTIIRGAEGNPLWKPVIDYIGIPYTFIFVPFVLLLFYFAIKGGGRIIEKVDKTPKAEELLLTTLVLVYFVFDLWVISVDFFGFRMIKNHYYFIPVLIIVALTYSLWAERYLKRLKR